MKRLAPLVAVAISLAVPASASAYDPANQPPFGGEPVPPLMELEDPDRPPSGFELTPAEVITIADHSEVIRAERQENGRMRPTAFTRGPGRWEVKYFLRNRGIRTEVAQAHVDDATGAVLEAWRDHQVETKLARGYDGAVGRAINSPWIWIALCLLFVAPFVDPRRPLRLIHLDLLVIVALSVSLLFFNRGEITASVPLTYPVLGYLFLRLLITGLRPRSDPGPLVPFVPVRALAALAVAVALFRIGLNVADSSVIDIGVAGVVGADRIADGSSLYEGAFAPGIDLRGDVYGPLNYILYVPFEAVFPWEGVWDDVPAAHAAAIFFDLATAIALFALGRRLRPAAEGKLLGVALAFAWLACPWTAYALNANTNDALVALAIVLAMLAVARTGGLTPEGQVSDLSQTGSDPSRMGGPIGAGLALAAGTAAKFGPVGLAPLFAAGTGERRWRSILIFAAAFAALTVVLFVPFLPDGGPGELYDRTFGYQASRGSPFSIWGLAPSLEPLQTVTRVIAVGLGLALAFVPSRRTVVQIAALGAAVVIATQGAGTHWFYFYVAWFLPLVLVAVFGEMRQISGSSSEARQASAS